MLLAIAPASASFQGRPAPDGRDFAGLLLPAAAQRADLSVFARRAWVWSEDGVSRVALDRDVRARVGIYDLNASRATVWIESITVDGRELRQLALYLEDVRDERADAAVAVNAASLLVTAMIDGDVSLRADVLERGRPDDFALASLVAAGEERLADYLASVEQAAPAPPDELEAPPGLVPPTVARATPRASRTTDPIATASDDLPEVAQAEPIFAGDGVVSFFGPDRTLITGEEENALVITGGVVVQYSDPPDPENPDEEPRTLQISAQRLVAFLEPGGIADLFRTGPSDVRGVYLEGDVVATDGSYTLRGPRVYYDVARNRAIVLDAVFWAYDEPRAAPFYIRADAIRQEAANQFSSGRATMANTAFFKPRFTIGATDLTLTRQPSGEGGVRHVVDAQNITASGWGVPFFYWPRYVGDPTEFPIRRFEIETKNGDPIIRTEWDLLSLVGRSSPEGFDSRLLIDGYFDRGPAGGLDLDWSGAGYDGAFFGYYIFDDGTDLLTSGAEIDHDDDHRGFVQFQHRTQLSENWSLFAEAAVLSDETFLDAFFPERAETERELTNSLQFRRLDDRSFLAIQGRIPSNDFVSNEFLLQSQGFQVERLPELTYARVADSFLGGRLLYFSEYRAGRLSFRFTEETAADLGFDTEQRANAAFGLSPSDRIDEALEAAGLDEDTVTRLDTRHEIAAPFDLGAFDITPFAVGRITAYDTEFSEFRQDQNDDQVRYWGGIGLRAATSIVRINNAVRSQLLDLDRIRHIIQPSATVMFTDTTLDRADLPVYDERVEAIGEGGLVRAGVTSTWQTKRAALDGERSVDWLMVRADYVNASGDADRRSTFPRFFESRPELSTFGEYIEGEAALKLTEATTLTTDMAYDFDRDSLSRAAAGMLFDHGYGFSTYVEWRKLRPLDAEDLNFGAAYELSRLYAIEGFVVYDLVDNNFQEVGVSVTRRLPQWTIEIAVEFDDVQDDLSFGVSFRPVGLKASRSARLFEDEPELFDSNYTPPGGLPGSR